MPNKFDPKIHHRRSIRLQGFDYTQPGGYYVTIVTHERASLFGEVLGGEMRLNAYGQIADECWCAIPDHFPHVELGIYVVMPNHIHGIIILNEHRRDAIYRVPTEHRAPTATTEQFGKPVAGSIPTIVRTYKAIKPPLRGKLVVN